MMRSTHVDGKRLLRRARHPVGAARIGRVACVALLTCACDGAEKKLRKDETPLRPDEPAAPTKLIPCLTPTPRSWDQKGFLETFAAAERVVPMICLPDPVDWWRAEERSAQTSKPFRDHQWQQVLLEQHKLDVFIQIDPYKTRRGKIAGLPKSISKSSFADPALREAFIADALQRLDLYQPRYLCLAMEINAYYEQQPADFDAFVSLFKEARRVIKQKRPATVVFVSFQYEQLLGRFGGQAGLPRHEPHWALFEKFEPEIDAIGISSYPMKTLTPPRYGSPDEVPADYYKQVGDHTDKPIVFAELGWPSDPAFGGSPESQSAFLKRFPALIDGLDVRLVNYNFLHDAKGFGPIFDSMGLIDSEGQPKPALAAFQALGPRSEPGARATGPPPT